MQGITPPTVAQLLAVGQVPLMKLELYDGDYWINICDGFSFLLSPCDATIDWTGTDLSIDTDDKKEGTGSLKDDIAVPVAGSWYATQYNPAGTWDWSAKKHILFWLKSDRASTAFTEVKFYIHDTSGNYRGWNLTFSAGEWTAVKKLLSTGDVESGTPPDLALINYGYIQFKAADTTPFYKKIDDLRIDDVAAGLEGKSYVEDVSISLGGASPTPNPIGGTWNATLFNEDGIFHPQHPTSARKGYCVTGRKVRISIGATYGGVDYYWQRIIGYMDEPKFSAPDYRVNISGGDYMKFLQDAEFQELDATYPNHWGLSTTFDSLPSDGLVGVELYNEADAMDITGEVDNVDDWNSPNCDFVSFGDVGGGSVYVGKVTNTEMEASYIENTNVINGNATIGTTYKIVFKYKRVAGSAFPMTAGIYQGAVKIGGKGGLNSSDWESVTLHAIAVAAVPIIMKFTFGDTGQEFRIDQISIWEYLPEEERYYDLTGADANQKGPYHVTYDDGGGVDPVQQGEEDEGWYYEEATGRVFFDRNKTVIDGAGLNNIVVYYYTATDPEDAVARILYFAGLYANEAAALAAMDNDDPAFAIDKVWFKAGSTFLNAIRMFCERCNYRFYFKYDGTPVFKAVPAPGGADFTFTSPAHIASSNTYQSRSEIKNRIIIKGIKQAEPVNREDTTPSELTGEAHDDTSIAAYGERTLTINNYLFQTQGPLDAMCATLLALYKDPKWYANLNIPFNPVPLELVDDIQWELRLSPVLNITQTGVIRDIKISNFNTTYKCEKT